ncbi:MAG: hypothetical protein Q9182_000275 [Xanthomendoza sp. 2 TL-2023]
MQFDRHRLRQSLRRSRQQCYKLPISGTSTTTATAPTATFTVTRTVTATSSLTLTVTTSQTSTVTSSLTITSTSSTLDSPASQCTPIATSLTATTATTVVLASPTAIEGSTTSAPELVDDETSSVDLPFPLSIGGASSSTAFVSPNGVSLDPNPSPRHSKKLHRPNPLEKQILSILDQANRYFNDPLPSENIAPYTLCPFWDDGVIFEGAPQGIFYQITAGGTQVTFEFLYAQFPSPDRLIHFLVSYSTAQPGVFIYTYLQVPESGVGATVGAQYGSPNPIGLQYSYNEAVITPGLVLSVDTNRNIITPCQ